MVSAQWLQTTYAADRQWLSQEHGVAAPLGASPSDAPLALPAAPPPQASKIAKRWIGVKLECGKALKSFGTDGWDRCKELVIGTLQKKVSGLQNLAASVGGGGCYALRRHGEVLRGPHLRQALHQSASGVREVQSQGASPWGLLRFPPWG